jgi:hypothetical protein
MKLKPIAKDHAVEAMLQRSKACASCPFLQDGHQYCFKPSVLRKTVVRAMRDGQIHPCHSDRRYGCSGYLAFAEKNLPGGVMGMLVPYIAHAMGIFDPQKINLELNVFGSIQEMLSTHRIRCIESVKTNEKA